MSDDTRPTDDELVSAYLDGEVTAEERARVERGGADLQHRLTELDAVRAALAAPPPGMSEGGRERALAAALDAFGTGQTGSVVGASPDDPVATAAPGVTELSTVRSRRSRLVVTLAAAAAVIVVLAASFTAIRRSTDTSSSDLAATAAAPSTTRADRAFESAPASPRAPAAANGGAAKSATPPTSSTTDQATAAPDPPAAAGASPTTVPRSTEASGTFLGDLGPASTTDELARLAATRFTERSNAAGATAGATAGADAPPATLRDIERCTAALRRTDPGRPEPTATATATLAGQPVLVVLTTTGTQSAVTVVRAADCTTVATTTL